MSMLTCVSRRRAFTSRKTADHLRDPSEFKLEEGGGGRGVEEKMGFLNFFKGVGGGGS